MATSLLRKKSVPHLLNIINSINIPYVKKKLALLLYGFALINIWSICFLSSGMVDHYTVAMGLSFTALSLYFVQREHDFNLSRSDKWVIMACPILLLCLTYYTLYDYGYFTMRRLDFVGLYQLLFYLHIINPVTIAFIMTLLGLGKLKDLGNPRNVFIFASIVVFYAYFFTQTWKIQWFNGKRVSFDTEISAPSANKKIAADELKTDINLAEFSFINAQHDTVTLLNHSDKYILLETWSETCPPCRKAMAEMPPFYRSIQDKVSVYYVYEHRKSSVRNNFDKIFSFNEIDDPTKILIDIEIELYQAMNMNGYPYFLLFDSSGKLVHHLYGYGGKEFVAEQISKYIQ